MNCAEFQRVLPYIIESGGKADEEEHLRSCKTCSDLVQDLRYIAEQAKLLVPMEDPSPKVWEEIRGTLEREFADHSGQDSRGRLLKGKGSISWIVALSALLIAAGAGMLPGRGANSVAALQAPAVSASPTSDSVPGREYDDRLLLSAMQRATPAA